VWQKGTVAEGDRPRPQAAACAPASFHGGMGTTGRRRIPPAGRYGANADTFM